jgi:hypothetical protein
MSKKIGDIVVIEDVPYVVTGPIKDLADHYYVAPIGIRVDPPLQYTDVTPEGDAAEPAAERTQA